MENINVISNYSGETLISGMDVSFDFTAHNGSINEVSFRFNTDSGEKITGSLNPNTEIIRYTVEGKGSVDSVMIMSVVSELKTITKRTLDVK